MPRSPSMKVIALRQEPVLPYPVSSVIVPLWARSEVMSTATSPSVPTVTGSSSSLPSRISFAVLMVLGSPTAARPRDEKCCDGILSSAPERRNGGGRSRRGNAGSGQLGPGLGGKGRGLEEAELQLGGLGHHARVPGRIPDHLDVRRCDAGDALGLFLDLLRQLLRRRAAGRGEGHLDRHFAAVLDRDVVDQSQLVDV